MNPSEVIKHINDGANYYLKFFGDAEHMEYHNCDTFCYIQPKSGEEGIKFVFDVHLETLSKEEQIKAIDTIKSLDMPVLWDLQTSDDLFELIHGKQKETAGTAPQEGDELYMAMFPNELERKIHVSDLYIKKVSNMDDFSVWANLQNDILGGGHQDIHPEKHYTWCEKGLLDCYLGYKDHRAVTFSSVLKNANICSLEFVGTHPDFRRQGFAEAVCYTALQNAFKQGAEIITVRAINPGTKELYTKLGFKINNFAL